MDDRPMQMPNDSYGKTLFPDHYNAPGCDWESTTPSYVAHFVHKQKNPLFAIKWMQEGKRLIAGTQKGEILTWNTQQLNSQTNTVHTANV